MKTPFKAEAEFEKELTDFANNHKTVIAEHSKHISDYHEMSCFCMIVRYYELKGFTSEIANLKSGGFKFKCSPRGLLKNFSYFKVKKDNHVYRIYHNASVQSIFGKHIFTTPDIVVTNDIEPVVIHDYYITKIGFSYIPNKQLVTFCEAKNFNPYPELMFNFVGIVHELLPSCMKNRNKSSRTDLHIAPSLMMSGSFSKQAKEIKESLEKRYDINILGNLFVDPYKLVFSYTGIPYLKKI